MRSYTRVFVGNCLFTTVCLLPVPLALLVGCIAWSEGDDWAWIAFTLGFVGVLGIVLMARRTTYKELPLVTRKNRLKVTKVSYGDNTFVMWAPHSANGTPAAELVRADVLEASLVRYSPEGEATFTSYWREYTPDEFTPLIRLRLRVHGAEDTDGADGFEITDEWRIPSLCLSAVTVGRLVVLVEPAAAPGQSRVVPQWPRSTLLAGTRTCRVIGLDGRTTEVTRRVGRQLRQMRISRAAGGVAMNGDTIDVRRLESRLAARYTELAEWAEAHPEDRAPSTEPGEEARWIVDDLPGERAGFGSVGRRWSRRGGVLALGRFLHMGGTDVFQDHGPVLDIVLRVYPVDGTPPFDAARRLTVPMDYLAVLHRTTDVVLSVNPGGTTYMIDWSRTSLLAGLAAATVIAPDGEEIPVTGRSETIWSLMNLLASQGLSNPSPVLDLRKRRMSPAAPTLLQAARSTPHRTKYAQRG
ncbi:hypothetical protein OG711_25275 [Streptomyces uncialis]|uniref:hypothetical protein n=1 Tax=Streptomyces uncialis TaxID=1048205 RepID=UPI002E356FE2|nr:hypothetical protein [Streptomyces uncialis]